MNVKNKILLLFAPPYQGKEKARENVQKKKESRYMEVGPEICLIVNCRLTMLKIKRICNKLQLQKLSIIFIHKKKLVFPANSFLFFH